jgi:nitric oxide reductase NorQ protein
MTYDINTPTIWFFETVNETNKYGIPRMRLLPGQFVPDGKGGFVGGDTDYNVQSDTAPRKANPIGTIFASKVVDTQKTPLGKSFYATGENNIITINRGISKDIADAYNSYIKNVGGTPLDEEEPAPGAAAGAPKPKSLIDSLEDKYPLPTVASHGFYVDRELWRTLLFNIEKGYNTMLVGESGTGKTELCILLGAVSGQTVDVFDMAAKQDPIASLIGVHRFDGGRSVFDRADFTFGLERAGIMVLDELPRAPMNTNNILFPVLDSRRELKMDIASSELRSIKVHPECRFIATANEGYRYTGNNVLDQALKERFQITQVDFMPEINEIQVLMARTGITHKDAGVIVKCARQIRDLVNKDELNQGVSVRHSLYAASLYAGGFSLVRSMEKAFLPMYSIEEEKKRVLDLLSAR